MCGMTDTSKTSMLLEDLAQHTCLSMNIFKLRRIEILATNRGGHVMSMSLILLELVLL
jgi:hypothetical protein